MLSVVSNMRTVTFEKEENAEHLLNDTKKDLVSLSNQLSKLVSKNDTVHTLIPQEPNDHEIEKNDVTFFKLPMKENEPPLKIFIKNNDKSEYIGKKLV